MLSGLFDVVRFHELDLTFRVEAAVKASVLGTQAQVKVTTTIPVQHHQKSCTPSNETRSVSFDDAAA